MATKVYGASDDLIEFDGDVYGEVGYYASGDDDREGCLLVFDDGTLLTARYGKAGLGVWAINLVRAGRLFDRIEPCLDEDADVHSDVAYFKDGLSLAWAANDWERVE